MKRQRRRRPCGFWQTESLEVRILLSADLAFRSFDGTGNNFEHEDWGAADTQLLRLTTVEYGEGTAGDFPALAGRVDTSGETINPRTVSNLLFNQDASVLNDRGLTSFVFQWGQFLDHDMDLTEDFEPVGRVTREGEDISFLVPTDGTEAELPPRTIIPQLRSRFEYDEAGVAQQINQITSYIDASNVYGSDAERADALRAHYGGFLLTSDGLSNRTDGSGQFLPFNFEVDGELLPNAAPPVTGTGYPLDPEDLFIAGDVRANEQPGLTALHTLFVREHNFQARRLAEELGYTSDDLADPRVDEQVYQLARAIVGAEMQSITYNEFLPALLGPNQLESYQGYQADVNASIANIFSGSLYRVGHTMLPNELLVLQPDGSPIAEVTALGATVVDGQLSLGDAFFNPELITRIGIESYLVGLSQQQIQEIDPLIVDGVRNLLFDPPAAVDLGATNLQRGRDHGLADYNQTRIDFGLEPFTDFAEISSDPAISAALQTAYDNQIDNIDVFAGAISEDRIPGGSVGQLIHTVLVNQFTRLRDGDRFYFENVFADKELHAIQNTRLSDIVARNSTLSDVPDELFRGDGVLTCRVPEGQARADLMLRVRGDMLEITKGQSSRVVATRPLATTQFVVFYGTSKNDTFIIESSALEAFGGVVEIHGGGGKDRLRVDGTASRDMMVDTGTVHVNDLSIYYGDVERLDFRLPDTELTGASAAEIPVALFAPSSEFDMATDDLSSLDAERDLSASIAPEPHALENPDSTVQELDAWWARQASDQSAAFLPLIPEATPSLDGSSLQTRSGLENVLAELVLT